MADRRELRDGASHRGGLPPEIDDEGHWGCVVRCPAIFDSNKRIPGIDAEQSIELADWFLRDLWNHFGIMPQLEQIELTYAARLR